MPENERCRSPNVCAPITLAIEADENRRAMAAFCRLAQTRVCKPMAFAVECGVERLQRLGRFAACRRRRLPQRGRRRAAAVVARAQRVFVRWIGRTEDVTAR